MKKKVLGLVIGGMLLTLTGCSLGNSGKILTCTARDDDQEIKYVMTFNKDGSLLEKVNASMCLKADESITVDMIEESLCSSTEMVKDTCKATKLKNGNIEINLSRKVLESDEQILGDFYINDNGSYEKAKENFEKNEWNSVEWSCK